MPARRPVARTDVMWQRRAYLHLLRVAAVASEPFTAKSVRESAYAAGLPQPRNESSWGGIFKRASMRNQIVVAIGARSRWSRFQAVILDGAPAL